MQQSVEESGHVDTAAEELAAGQVGDDVAAKASMRRAIQLQKA